MDWGKVAYFCLLSRFMDLKEKSERLPMSFPAMGHELVQVLTALLMEHEKDAASVYYRSRPLALALGMKPEDIFYANMGKGRDVGMMYYLRGKILPTVGDVGGQFPKAVGWAQAIRYKGWDGAVAVAMGGDGSVASSGFWSALNIATTLNLPMVFVIEDNGWGIGVPSYLQTPGGNIAENLRSFKNLTVLDGRGYIPEETYSVLKEGFGIARKNRAVLIRFEVARIEGHSISDRQEYRSREEIEKSREKDPIVYLRSLVENWEEVESRAKEDVERAWEEAKRREGERGNLKKHIFFEGEFAQGDKVREFKMNKHPKMKMALAIRKAMEEALEENEDVLIFGEDVGLKGGIYGITRGFMERFGERRVFDTSLNELGIVGRAEGMAYAGLKPIAEIQFRKYADEARQAIHNIGFVRWRTNNAFSAPIILRMPVGFIRGISDPWHSFSAEQEFLHMFGWKIAYPSNAEDAYYLLKEAISMNDPVIFLEHRELYFSKLAEREISEYLPFGKGRVVKSGNSLTIVSWGYTLYEALEGVKDMDVEVIDLRTLKPWDEELVFESVKKTGRLIVVHEDSLTCGFGAEIVSRVVEETFESLKIAPKRLAVPDVPIPFSQELFNLAYPTSDKIRKVVEEMLSQKT
ncbi:MAG: thiamine pyrophosphate-dependent enzyme [Candidatus Caldipriscus sp.]|nr:thiamine pyrophosphate-dependent enzyme [Candidatus Caldipriscus sp.]